MPSDKYLKNAKWVALLSFLLGTAIFIFYYLTAAGWLLFAGYAFIILAGLVNLVILIDILLKGTKGKGQGKSKMYKTCALMLVNIPVVLFYCRVTVLLLSTMRVTLTNSTRTELTNIALSGCESKFITSLKPGQSKEVWVGINGDCSITVTYLSNGQQKKVIIAGYVTGGMGEKLHYYIDDKINPLSKSF
jgi:hypothetical protein